MFARFNSEISSPYCIEAWDRDGPHCYSASSHIEARRAAKTLSSNGKYAVIYRMQESIPQRIEDVYRNGIEEPLN